MRARDAMTSPAITCHVNDSLAVAAQKMWDSDIGVLAVVKDDGKLTGMITDRDICMAALTQGRALDELLVNLAMAKKVVASSPDTPVGDVEQLMAQHQIRRVPIVDDAGKPIGIISMNNLVIASVRPKAETNHGPSKIVSTLAAISQHRDPEPQQGGMS